MDIEIPWWYYILPAGLASTAIACLTLNAVVLPVMVVIRLCQGSNQTKNFIKTSLWLSMWVSELFNSSHYIVMSTLTFYKWFTAEEWRILLKYVKVVSPVTAIVYATGLIGLSVEMILRPWLRRFRRRTHVAVAVGCFFAPWCFALVLVLSLYSHKSFQGFYFEYDTWVSVFNLVLNTLAPALSIHITCLSVLRSRFASARLASARIQQPGESGSESLASQEVNQDFPRNYGSINSGSSNVEIDSSRLLLDNSITSPEASSSTLPHREDVLSGCVGLPQNVVGSKPSDHVEPLNNPPSHYVMVSPQEETEAEETTSPQTPLLPQTDSNISSLNDNPKKESVYILVVTIISAKLMYPYWIIKLINPRSYFSESVYYLPFNMITLQLSCLRSLVLALSLIFFLPTSARRITQDFESKILF